MKFSAVSVWSALVVLAHFAMIGNAEPVSECNEDNRGEECHVSSTDVSAGCALDVDVGMCTWTSMGELCLAQEAMVMNGEECGEFDGCRCLLGVCLDGSMSHHCSDSEEES